MNSFSEPLGLLKALIYIKHKYAQVKVDTLCVQMAKEAGVTWNKQFKSHYGPIEKFLRKYDDIFELSPCSKLVRLKNSVTPDSIRPDTIYVDEQSVKETTPERKEIDPDSDNKGKYKC